MGNDKKEKGSNKHFIVVGLVVAIIVFIIILILNSSSSSENNFNMVSVENSSIEKVENTEKSSALCTKIEYSNWPLCSKEGTRIRSIISAYPQGCDLSNDNNIKQQESCIYVPIKLDAGTLMQKIFQQISQAPGKTIETEYVSGQYGNITNTVKYVIANDNNLVIWTESKDRQSGKVISNLYLRDSNQDFRPDIISNDGAEWYPIDIQSQTDQVQILVVWATQVTYFAETLLKI